jgi:hypothetical protein
MPRESRFYVFLKKWASHPPSETSPIRTSQEYRNESHQAEPRHKTYSTFSKDIQSHEKLAKKSISPLKRSTYQFWGSTSKRLCPPTLNDKQIVTETNTWIAIIFISIAVAIAGCLHGQSYYYISPAWNFDYNVYIPRGDDYNPLGSRRISLIAQIDSSRSLQQLADISGRPNRAYAKEWGMDYVRYDSGHGTVNQISCFDKINVLNIIMDKQRKYETNSSDSSSLSSRSWVLPSERVLQYESIILLPTDAIITELDTNLVDAMLPRNKLAAISGLDINMKLRSNSGIVVFNTKHEHSNAVARLWLDMTIDTTCGANNDLDILLAAISSVLEEKETLENLLEPLYESRNGFVGDRLIRSIIPSVPGSRSAYLLRNIEESSASLQEIADSVCYRFYPKCEVL